MGFFCLMIGGIIGYHLSERVVAKNWLVKIGWALGAPIALLLPVFIFLGLITDGYTSGDYGFFVFIASIPYTILVFVKMKRTNKQ